MGFQRRTYNLIFTDESFSGFEVRARGGSVDDAMAMMRLLSLGGAFLHPTDEARRADREELYALLAGARHGGIGGLLLGWNLEDDNGQPVPLTNDQLHKEELALIITVAKSWLDAVIGVPPPLSPRSPNGEPSPEQFELMEAASVGQQN